MKKLILLFTLIIAGFFTISAQKATNAIAESQICSITSLVSEGSLGTTVQGFVSEGCTHIHAREVFNRWWFPYGTKLWTAPYSPAPQIVSPDVCGPVESTEKGVGAEAQNIAESGCTEIHIRKIDTNIWTAYGVRLVTF